MSLREYGREIWSSSPTLQLVKERGRVTDAIVRCINLDIRVRASRGVVLATGSFARNALLEWTSVVHTSITLSPDITVTALSLQPRSAAIDKDVASAGFWISVSILKRGSGSQIVPHTTFRFESYVMFSADAILAGAGRVIRQPGIRRQ
ncbi:FAD-binding protein [Bradyrhizobium sp. NBAIM01]|nr:FAD-binding protein [Bradyrhizobium sp. NBAIM01]